MGMHTNTNSTLVERYELSGYLWVQRSHVVHHAHSSFLLAPKPVLTPTTTAAM
jgi:hypothetical protein